MDIIIGKPKRVTQDGQLQILAEGDQPMIIDPDERGGVPVIVLQHDEVDLKSGSGDRFDTVEIDVKGSDGKIGRFWIDVHFDHQGKPICTVATNVKGNSKSVRLRGEWR